MKKITFLFLMASTMVFAQQPQSFVEQGTQQIVPNSNQETVITIVNDRQPLIDTYNTLSDFNDGVTANCSDPTLTSEDFSSAPAGINTCGPVISSAGDGCFGAGDLEDGFSVEASNGTDIVAISSGQIGNADALVGANTFAEFTIINFSPEVYAVAMDIWNNSENTTDVRVYGTGGTLIETLVLSTPAGTQTFAGFISDEPIERVELEGLAGSGELFGNFLFGADCMVLGVNDNALSQVAVYPNPASDILNIEVPGNIEIISAYVYDVTGKRMTAPVVNNQLNIADLSNGVYLVQINTSQGNITRKIVKK